MEGQEKSNYDCKSVKPENLSIGYIQHIKIFNSIINLNVFISLGLGKPEDFEIGIKDLKEKIDKTLRSTPNVK